jgi:hypothetical protein
MSIYTPPGATIEATLGGAPTGLTGTLGVRVLDNAGATTIARATAGITEFPAGSGFYAATLTAPVVAGQYTIFWDTGTVSPASTASEDLIVTFSPAVTGPSGVTPTRGDVGSVLRARTRSDATGNEIGTFDATTRPTGTEVDEYISLAVDDVILRIPAPDDLPDNLARIAKRIATIRAAMFVEIALEGDRTTDSDSVYARLKELYDTGMAGLNDVLEDTSAGGANFRFADMSLTTPTAQSAINDYGYVPGAYFGDDLCEW